MKMTTISASYDRTVTNPTDRYAPYKFGAAGTAQLEDGETLAGELPKLQEALQKLVEREIARVVPRASGERL